MIRFSLHYFFFFATFAVVTPFFQVFLRARGFDEAQVGLLLGVFSLAGAMGTVAVGHLADRLGKRRVMLAGSLVVAAAVLTPMNAMEGFWPVAVGAAVFGLAYKSIIPLADALAATELPDPAHQYGRARAMGSLGFILMLWATRLLGLIDPTSSTSILLCFLATAAVSLPLMLALPDNHRSRAVHAQGGAGGFDAGFWVLMAVVFLGQLGMASHYSFFSLFLQDAYRQDNPQIFWSIGSICEMPMIFYAGFLLRRIGVVGMLVASLAAVAVRLSIYASGAPLAMIVLAQTLHAFTFGASHTAAVEFIRRKVPRGRQGLAMTIYISLVHGLAQMLGASAGGFLVKFSGYGTMYLAFAVAPLAGLVLLAAARKRLALAA